MDWISVLIFDVLIFVSVFQLNSEKSPFQRTYAAQVCNFLLLCQNRSFICFASSVHV